MQLIEAELAIKAARAKAIEMGVAMAIAVVNESGVLTAFIRMDNSNWSLFLWLRIKLIPLWSTGFPPRNWGSNASQADLYLDSRLTLEDAW